MIADMGTAIVIRVPVAVWGKNGGRLGEKEGGRVMEVGLLGLDVSEGNECH